MDGYGKRALIVDDDPHDRLLMSRVLDYAGYNVIPACDGLTALNELSKRHVDVIITDCDMPQLNGVELVRRARVAYPHLPVIVVSENIPDTASRSDGRPFAYLRKPYDNLVLLDLVRSAVSAVAWFHMLNNHQVADDESIDQTILSAVVAPNTSASLCFAEQGKYDYAVRLDGNLASVRARPRGERVDRLARNEKSQSRRAI